MKVAKSALLLHTVFLLALALAGIGEAAAFTEIPVRESRDGAGPSHIFALQGDVLAVVDPLGGTIAAYRTADGTVAKSARLPQRARPWRLTRSENAVVIISEDRTQKIVVPREIAAWPAQFESSDIRPNDPDLRTKRTKSGLRLSAYGRKRALTVKPVGPYY